MANISAIINNDRCTLLIFLRSDRITCLSTELLRLLNEKQHIDGELKERKIVN